ncbi:heme ABC exporter ATP-binding protein CcmA [Loktanella sp. TSTF-M6]|uniref:Heme ABC exporter ATP-binding protein CcmA n=1 Tax=Loktanella gaetbuli TaxID=2881335 RepID=A0ABS8BQA1_9RHOB|nr:heme ABC exporter ATP-binding protein CcmA [Loktanella gaetbuli]MCB5197905.1 heme ABC exporter ATP-binding protein CcmA [Loktanella gaetbuli]
MLQVTDLRCARGGVPVLERVSFALNPGEAMILRGPNGVGKTTLLRTMAGLQPPLSGTVDYPEGSGAYASHADGIKSALTVTENLTFWAQIHDRSVPETAYAAFDLHDLRDRLAGTLSAGQKRRLGLARLAVIGRSVLFLDEPTVSLDNFSVRMFADWMRDAHLGQGGCAVIATHIDLGLDVPALDLTPYIAAADADGGADAAFL